ncbi:hypothetical protein BX666DRAFT_2027197 [Dichotomocladium elegans]|nr:hypothetical protein BX666DRAFT_2027197 [Dichotomocladium elegans]
MAAHTLSTYRNLLREVNRQFAKKNTIFVNQLKSIYRENQFVTDPEKLNALNRNADNELRDRYSAIVLEQKKKIEMSAKRVGLQLPKQFEADAANDRVMDAFHKTTQ